MNRTVESNLLILLGNSLDPSSDLLYSIYAKSSIHQMNFFWVGTYFVEKKDLVLGPFQGPPACSRIPKGKGVCGRSWEEEISFVVPDVDGFPGHISCNAQSKSEIVIPVKTKEGKVFMVLDIDSDKLNDLDQKDLLYLEKVTTILQEIYPKNAQY